MWGQAMGVIEQWLDDETFTPPDTASLLNAAGTVPSVGGLSIASATRLIEEAGFTAIVGPEVNSGYTEGTVAYTDPGSGEAYFDGAPVTIYVSNGYVPPPPPPPDNGGGGGGGGDGDDNDNGGRKRRRPGRRAAAQVAGGGPG